MFKLKFVQLLFKQFLLLNVPFSFSFQAHEFLLNFTVLDICRFIIFILVFQLFLRCFQLSFLSVQLLSQSLIFGLGQTHLLFKFFDLFLVGCDLLQTLFTHFIQLFFLLKRQFVELSLSFCELVLSFGQLFFERIYLVHQICFLVLVQIVLLKEFCHLLLELSFRRIMHSQLFLKLGNLCFQITLYCFCLLQLLSHFLFLFLELVLKFNSSGLFSLQFLRQLLLHRFELFDFLLHLFE